MSPRTSLPWLAALALALLLGLSWQLDGPDDIAAAQAVADDLATAPTQVRAEVLAEARTTRVTQTGAAR